jgi:hypothetical protein
MRDEGVNFLALDTLAGNIFSDHYGGLVVFSALGYHVLGRQIYGRQPTSRRRQSGVMSTGAVVHHMATGTWRPWRAS